MNITDPRFKWTPACATDIRKTFARVGSDEEWASRLEGAREVMRKIQAEAAKVVPIRRTK